MSLYWRNRQETLDVGLELAAVAGAFIFGYILGQEHHNKEFEAAPRGRCARCDTPLKEDEGAICALCVDAALLDEEWSR